MASTKKKLAFLREHLAYERTMIVHASAQLRSESDQSRWNMAFAAFAVSARNIYDFLCSEADNRNFNAKDYVAGFSAEKEPGLFNRLDPAVFHMGKSRVDGSKFDIADIDRAISWIDSAWSSWSALLSAPFSDGLDTAPIQPSAGITFTGARLTATNSPVSEVFFTNLSANQAKP